MLGQSIIPESIDRPNATNRKVVPKERGKDARCSIRRLTVTKLVCRDTPSDTLPAATRNALVYDSFGSAISYPYPCWCYLNDGRRVIP